ncbi:MAG TPA: DUF1631 family protein [Luteimonas sp.]|nr:DUF1631 family protein [Luteimonas sp.]
MAAVAVADPARLLDELRRIAVEQLGAVLGGLYRPIEDQLQDSLRAGHVGSQRKDLMTVLALRQRSAGHVMRYRELIGNSFDDFRGRVVHGHHDLPLSLVGEGELHFHLAGQHLAESIGRRYQQPLEMLDLRFEALANTLRATATSNPVGAARLAGAFLQVFRDADISQTLQPLLFRQYEQELGKVLGDLYGRLNAQLAAHGFHADARRESATATPVASPPTAASATPVASTNAVPVAPPPAMANAGIDLFRVSAEARVEHQRLRDMLHTWREGALADLSVASEHQPGPRLAERRELRVQELVSVASLLQRDGTQKLQSALADQRGLNHAIRADLLEGARRLGLDPDSTRLGEHEEDAIDLVGLMFESLLGSHALVDQARRMFMRLVMSYVKIALTDENLFVRPDHPARRLLDALALSCESNDGASPQDRDLLQRAGALVERVVADYHEDLAIFELTANELQDLLQQQRRRAEVVERRSAETVHGRERLLQARLQAASMLAQRMSRQPLTTTIAHFLERHWQHHLVQVMLREGQGSEHCAQVLALGDELIAVDQAAARGEGRSVAGRVLDLHAGLVECLSSSGLDDQIAGEWMAGLARTLAFPDIPREQRPAPAMPQLADDSDDTRLLQVVGGNAALDFDPVVAKRIAALGPGNWMRLIDEGGQEGSVKVAWISPLTSRLLLVNRRGVRKLVASPQQLAALVKADRLFADADDLPFDEAMRQVRQRLSQATNQAA